MQALIAKAYSIVHAKSAESKVKKVKKFFNSNNLQGMEDVQLVTRFNQYSEKFLQGDSSAVFPLVAFVYEAIFRINGYYLHDCQIEGSFLLLDKRVVEMKTGEGKTVTIVPAAIIRAITKKGVHIITANEYLASRDASLMKPIYNFFGISCEALIESQSIPEKKEAYNADVTYGIASSFGFDYLRDNLVLNDSDIVQRGLHSAIVDEVDSILIDDARTPLIISRKDDASDDVLYALCAIIKEMTPNEHYILDFVKFDASFNDNGYEVLETFFEDNGYSDKKDLYLKNAHLITYAVSCLKACTLFTKNKDYIVTSEGTISLIDSGTGRVLDGRRLSGGVHEAIEAKEQLQIKEGTKSIASISFQNFFSLYSNLSGLSGTALTESLEFSSIYGMEVVEVPTHIPSKRIKREDQLYFNKIDKFEGIVELIIETRESGRPILVGTDSVRDAELLSSLLSKRSVIHNLLTAKYADKEALIIAEAGLPFSVTIATNMAGRGTDIELGGSRNIANWEESREQVLSAGGLFVIGASRNTLRRVDNQLLGRCARQGDPGEYIFFSSLQDELFASFEDKFRETLNGYVSGSKFVTGSIVDKFVTMAQVKFENIGFSQRESLMKFDKINNDQQATMFSMRKLARDSKPSEYLIGISEEVADFWVNSVIPEFEEFTEKLDAVSIKNDLMSAFNINAPVIKWANSMDIIEFKLSLKNAITSKVLELVNSEGYTDSSPIVAALDSEWSSHLMLMQDLNQSINYRSIIGKNPVFEYSNEGFQLFSVFVSSLYFKIISDFCLKNVTQESSEPLKTSPNLTPNQKVYLALQKSPVGRNDLCPCGSLKKFKECHGLMPEFN